MESRKDRSPWKHNETAFDLMYDECVSIKPKNGMRTTKQCCIFIDNTADSLSEDMQETNREDIILTFRDCDSKYVNTLKRGDVIYRVEHGNKTYAVQSVVDDRVMGLVVKARSNGK